MICLIRSRSTPSSCPEQTPIRASSDECDKLNRSAAGPSPASMSIARNRAQACHGRPPETAPRRVIRPKDPRGSRAMPPDSVRTDDDLVPAQTGRPALARHQRGRLIPVPVPPSLLRQWPILNPDQRAKHARRLGSAQRDLCRDAIRKGRDAPELQSHDPFRHDWPHRFRPVFTWTLAFLVASLTFLDDTTETDGRFSHNKRAANLRGRTTSMSLRPFQFTILQLATLIVSFAIVFAFTRSVTGPVFFAFFSAPHSLNGPERTRDSWAVPSLALFFS